MQKARQGMSVSDEQVATYTAAMGFLVAEWAGALLMVASFTQLYAYGLRPGANVTLSLVVGGVLLLAGSFMYWTNRRNYLAMEFPWRRRWEVTATIFAAAGAVFWFLFIMAAVLVWRGVPAFGS